MQKIEVTYTNLQRLFEKNVDDHYALAGFKPTTEASFRLKAERLAELDQGFDVIYALMTWIEVQR